MKRSMLALVLAALCALPALAAQDTVRIFLWDNDAGETAQDGPAAVMDRNYNTCYVWSDKRDGNWNIYGRLWGNKPAPRTPSFLVNEKARDERDQKAPDVASKSDEFVFVVWQDSVYKEPFWQVYGRKIKPDGTPLSEVFRINQVVARHAKFPKIAVNPKTQEFVVVWQDDRNGDWDIYGRLFGPDCKPLSNDVKICEDPDKKNQQLPVVCAGEKYYMVAWWDRRTGSRIYMRQMKSDLYPATQEIMICDNIDAIHTAPTIAASDTGFFTIAWINTTGNPAGSIFAQRFDPDAKPIDKNFQVNLTPSDIPCRIPSITMNADNVSFWISWADSASSNHYEIKARYFDYAGRWEHVQLVNNNPIGGQRAPAVCRFGQWFSVAWLDSSRTAGLGDIYGQYFTNSIKAEQDTLKKVDIN